MVRHNVFKLWQTCFLYINKILKGYIIDKGILRDIKELTQLISTNLFRYTVSIYWST